MMNNNTSCINADLTNSLHREYSFYSIAKWLNHSKNVEKIKERRYYEVMPVTAQLVPTLHCNFNCPRCSYGQLKKNIASRHKQALMNMSGETMKLIIKRLGEAGIKGLVFTGGGEPTLNPFLIDGMQYATEIGLNIGLFTNGSLLSEDKIRKILELKPTFLRITLDAGTQTVHQLLNGYDKKCNYFAKILNNLEFMAKEKVRLGLKTTIGVGVSVEPVNLNDLVEVAKVLRLIAEKKPIGGIDYVVFRPVVNYRYGKFFKNVAPMLEFLQKEMPDYYEAYKNYLYKGVQLPSKLFKQANAIIEGPVHSILSGTSVEVVNIRTKMLGVASANRPFSKCRASPWYIFIGPDGTVYNCVELGLDPRVSIGNLLTHSLDEIWSSFRHQEVLDYINHEGLNNLCPPVCLYYEMNALFEKLDNLFQSDEAKHNIALHWIEEQEKKLELECENGKLRKQDMSFI